MNIKSKIPRMLDPRNIFSSQNNLLAAIVVLALIAGAATFFYQQNNNKPPEDPYQLVIDIKQLEREGDCQKGLDQLKSYKTQSVDLSQPAAQEKVNDVLSYRVDCNYQLGDYDEALNYATEQQKFYQENGWSDFQKQSIAEQIEIIEISKETERQDKINREKPAKTEDAFDGPRL